MYFRFWVQIGPNFVASNGDRQVWNKSEMGLMDGAFASGESRLVGGRRVFLRIDEIWSRIEEP